MTDAPGIELPVNWYEIDRHILARRPGMLPRQIDDMTLSEIILCREVPLPLQEDDAARHRAMADADIYEGALEDHCLGARGRLLRALRQRR